LWEYRYDYYYSGDGGQTWTFNFAKSYIVWEPEKSGNIDWQPYNSALNGLSGLGTGMVAMDGTFRLTNGGYNGNKLSLKHYSSGWRGGSVAKIKTHSMLKWGRAIGWGATITGGVLSILEVGFIMSQDDWSFNSEAQLAAAEAAGGLAGAWSGAIVGASVGAMFGGVGAIPGAIIGAIGVGWAGSYVGGRTYGLFK